MPKKLLFSVCLLIASLFSFTAHNLLANEMDLADSELVIEEDSQDVDTTEEFTEELTEETTETSQNLPTVQVGMQGIVESTNTLTTLASTTGGLSLPMTESVMELNEQNTLILLENSIQAEKFRSELLSLEHEKNKLVLENELSLERLRHQLAELNAQKERILLENEVLDAKHTQVLADLVIEKTRLELENAISTEERNQISAELQKEIAKLKVENEIAEQRNLSKELEISLALTELNFESAKLEFEKAKRTADIQELSERITEREQRELWESEANKQPELLEEPFVEGKLIISDRKIYLDPVVISGTADYVSSRIDYFNNKDTDYPIFLVIDVCYGGSVAEGAKILEAMAASPSPVYVVVKSMAASMAAVITALAERSYAYPNAIILHHQMWGMSWGNVKEQQEQLDFMKEWSRRLMKPVADKMGVSMDEMVELMYENNSNGDWSEFADNAVSLKWVDYIANEIRDTSFIKRPSGEKRSLADLFELDDRKIQEQVDPQGNRFVQLPRPAPLDFYHLYNPDNYYRY
jgi:ATP-dependent Clp protease, protease subunit